MDVPSVDIAIIVVPYNTLYEECLTSLGEAMKQSRYTTKAIFVDNNSTAFHADELIGKFLPQAKVILRDKNHGFGRSMNYGANRVHAKYYFILNPDTNLIDPDILNKLVAYAESHPDAGVIAPKLTNFDGTRQDTCRRFPTWYQPIVQRTRLGKTTWGKRYSEHFLMHDFDQTTERPIDWAQGSALFVPGDVWRDLGGFDDFFWVYFEDIDLCRRVWASGKKVMYVPSITLHHAYRRTSAAIPNIMLNIMKSQATRAHIVSGLKYMWKWKLMPPTRSASSQE